MPDTKEQILARKIFFLFAPKTLEDELVRPLVSMEFEAYSFNDDSGQYLPAVEKFPDSILIAYIERGEENPLWDDWYKRLSAMEFVPTIVSWIGDSGYLTIDPDRSNHTPSLTQIDLAGGFQPVIALFTSLLDSLNAKGNRKHIRTLCGDSLQASFSIKRLDQNYNGIIQYISSFGMACTFDREIELKIHLFIEDLQIRILGQNFSIAGSILSKRVIDEKTVYVIVFDYLKNPEAHTAVHEFVYMMLQRNFRKQHQP